MAREKKIIRCEWDGDHPLAGTDLRFTGDMPWGASKMGILGGTEAAGAMSRAFDACLIGGTLCYDRLIWEPGHPDADEDDLHWEPVRATATVETMEDVPSELVVDIVEAWSEGVQRPPAESESRTPGGSQPAESAPPTSPALSETPSTGTNNGSTSTPSARVGVSQKSS